MKATEYPGGPPYTCPECGSNDWEIHGEKEVPFGKVKILKCISCGHIEE